MTKTQHHVRWMIRRDLPDVVNINKLSGGEWDKEAFLSCLRDRNCIGMVVEVGLRHEEQVVGFTIYLLGKTSIRPILLVVHPAFRRTGIGTEMVEKLKYKTVQTHRRQYCSVAVKETNYPLLCLLRKHDFRAIKVLPGAFPNCDGISMVYENPKYEEDR